MYYKNCLPLKVLDISDAFMKAQSLIYESSWEKALFNIDVDILNFIPHETFSIVSVEIITISSY